MEGAAGGPGSAPSPTFIHQFSQDDLCVDIFKNRSNSNQFNSAKAPTATTRPQKQFLSQQRNAPIPRQPQTKKKRPSSRERSSVIKDRKFQSLRLTGVSVPETPETFKTKVNL
jgi:hypothetical protein